MSDLDVLKEIPGYKAILKSVLKSQIQLLMQQLSEHAGEESIIMTASVHDGTLSHLGSSTGKGFLEGRDEIKSQFLGYCLKTYHKQKTHEPQKPYQRTHPSPRSPAQMSLQSSKRPRLHSASPGNTYPPVTSSFPPSSGVYHGQSGTDSGSADDIVQVKTEITDHQSENTQTRTMDTLPRPTAIATIPDTIHLPHTLTTPSTQISSDLRASVSSIESETGQDVNDTEDTDNSNISNIKVEQVEDELEITGVEMAAANWGQGHGQIGFGTDDDSSFNQSANQSGYRKTFQDGRKLVEDVSNNNINTTNNNNNFIKRTLTPIYKRHVTGEIQGSSKDKDLHGYPFTGAGHCHDRLEDKTQAPGWQPMNTEMLASSKDKHANNSALSQPVFSEAMVLNLPLDTGFAALDFSKLGYQQMTDKEDKGGNISGALDKGDKWLEHGFLTGDTYRPYGCKYCPKKFTYKADLKRHVRIHTGERPFKCSYCPKSFTQSTHLKLHVVRHMDLNPAMFDEQK